MMEGVPVDFISSLMQANKGLALVTVILVQIVKMFIPSDPDAPVGGGRFTVAPRYRKFLLLLTFAIAVALSFLLDPHEGQSVQGKLTDGLQTGAYAVVFWEVYTNWVRPILERRMEPA